MSPEADIKFKPSGKTVVVPEVLPSQRMNGKTCQKYATRQENGLRKVII